MTGKAVEYFAALKSCGRAPVSRYTRTHWHRRHAYGSARNSGMSHEVPLQNCGKRGQGTQSM